MDLFNNFDNLCFDLKNMICKEVGIIKDTEKNKKYYNGYILGELKYKNNNNDIKNILNRIFEDTYNAGTKMLNDGNIEFNIDTYYKNLDYLYMCELNTNIDFINKEINFTYYPKPNYIHICNLLKKEEDDLLNGDYDDYWGLTYNCHTCCYDLEDFIPYYSNRLIDIDEEYLDNMYENRDENRLKEILFRCRNREIFGFQLQY